MTRYVYLAGPIAGCTKGEAKDWRDVVEDILTGYGLVGVSPLRCEPDVSERYADAETYQLTYAGHHFGTAQGIFHKNWLDTNKCDAVLIYLPKPKKGSRPSVGTMIELGWAIGLRKPIILVTDDDYIRKHPLTSYGVGYITDSVEEAAHIAGDLLGVYT